MSGHSKWSQIKFQKAIKDLRRGKEFSKLINAITAAAKQGGGDVSSNLRLRLLLEQARQSNLPRENVERAIKRGTGQLPGVVVEEALYEVIGPQGVGILISAFTDNKNRTTSNLKSILNRYGGKLASPGAVSYNFIQQGVLVLDKGGEEQELWAIEAGAIDFVTEEGSLFVYTEPSDLEKVKKFFEEKGAEIKSAQLSFEPKNLVEIKETKSAGQVLNLVNALEEMEEVSDIYSNFDIPTEIVENR
ncbi:YebC/PmpR family DNA-binding transcriptional regulator [Candidatus Berkelbacteria bacterium]|nr:YebC/PmpR family DNA-binding transcriptional regulator [Candidatus Berkelbacteria bacterium]MBI2588368.1 YebC/PmpR family DNA-binding transcriptional regulator [Candidatus Berkelbacteria bacterium]MBI4029910.1 YebC/PmpR family DNA-binding transcriptional regulator [Candidatus Berkelbacteria bacterium]